MKGRAEFSFMILYSRIHTLMQRVLITTFPRHPLLVCGPPYLKPQHHPQNSSHKTDNPSPTRPHPPPKPSQITRIVIRHLLLQPSRNQLPPINQLRQQLGVMHNFELPSELHVIVLQGAITMRRYRNDPFHNHSKRTRSSPIGSNAPRRHMPCCFPKGLYSQHAHSLLSL